MVQGEDAGEGAPGEIDLPRKVKHLPGFFRADEIPPGGVEWEPLPHEADQPIARSRARARKKNRVDSLREAATLFSVSLDVAKSKDVKLGGARVGILFRDNLMDETYLLLFKREPYHYFSKHFLHVPDKGYGVISNLKLVQWCAQEGYRIAMMFPNGRCYRCEASDFLSYSERYDTEVPHDKAEIAYPFKKMKRLF